jgi:ketosteroid isomerase-like protein
MLVPCGPNGPPAPVNSGVRPQLKLATSTINVPRNQMKNFAAFAIAIFFTCAAAPCFADDSTRTFERIYAAFRQAMDKKDSKSIAEMLAPGFVSEDVSGKTQSADQLLSSLNATTKDPSTLSQTTVISADTKGDLTTVLQRYQATSNRLSADGQTKLTEIVAQSSDTWRRIDGAWRLQKTVTEQLDYRVSGKLVAHKIHENH